MAPVNTPQSLWLGGRLPRAQEWSSAWDVPSWLPEKGLGVWMWWAVITPSNQKGTHTRQPGGQHYLFHNKRRCAVLFSLWSLQRVLKEVQEWACTWPTKTVRSYLWPSQVNQGNSKGTHARAAVWSPITGVRAEVHSCPRWGPSLRAHILFWDERETLILF